MVPDDTTPNECEMFEESLMEQLSKDSSEETTETEDEDDPEKE